MGERGEPAGLWSRDDPFGTRGLGTEAGEVVTGSGAIRGLDAGPQTVTRGVTEEGGAWTR